MLHRLTYHDQRLLSLLSDVQAPVWLDRFLRHTTHAGGATVTVLVCLALLLHPDTHALGVIAATANLVSHLMVQVLKRVVVRPRPSAARADLEALVRLPDHYSFPSGHACAAMAVAVSLVLWAPPLGLPAVALALVVGGSRIYLRVHYVTDVLVGQAIGAASALLAYRTLA